VYLLTQSLQNICKRSIALHAEPATASGPDLRSASMQMRFCDHCHLLGLQYSMHMTELPVLCQQSEHLVRDAARQLNTQQGLDGVRFLVRLRVSPGHPDSISHLLAGCEQFVPSKTLELHMTHMALLEPCDDSRGQHRSWPTGLVPPLVVLDVQNQTEHDLSSLTHASF